MLYLNQLAKGMCFSFPEVRLTQGRRDKHVAKYGEDWPEPIAGIMRQRGVIPSTLVISIVGGQMGKSGWFALYFLDDYHFKPRKSFCVGDILVTRCVVTRVSANHNPDKDWGYVWVDQEMQNARTGEVIYQREVKYAVLNEEATLQWLLDNYTVA